jgi:hypothetical protein
VTVAPLDSVVPDLSSFDHLEHCSLALRLIGASRVHDDVIADVRVHRILRVVSS